MRNPKYKDKCNVKGLYVQTIYFKGKVHASLGKGQSSFLATLETCSSLKFFFQKNNFH